MAQKRRFLDVWIVESNTVYREVPFMVVTDWVQQGRLLADDKVRPSGTAQWYPIGGSPTFAPYLPKVEEHRAEDQAEALEPVQMDFTWKGRAEDDDDDVDMIPLIDISLVLLIFFMMVSVGGYVFGNIDIPEARQKREALAEDMKLWVGVDDKEKPGVPRYSLGLDREVIVEPTPNRGELLTKFQEQLDRAVGTVRVRIQANKSLPIEVIKGLTEELKRAQNTLKPPGRVRVEIVGEVAEPR
jgi:biopolymer transport protein ExbD